MQTPPRDEGECLVELQIFFERGVRAVVECEPGEGAVLLADLARRLSGASSGGDAGPSSPRPSWVSAAASRTSHAPESSHGAKTKRRTMVLDVFHHLRSRGVHTPNLGEIRECFQLLFPGEDLKNLDQVVRDLANKTDQVESGKRGEYQLTE